MRPCQQCNGPVENQQRRCPSCGAVQVPSVGLTAPLVEPPPEVDEEEWREEAVFRRVLPACAGLTVVGLPLLGWLASGPFGLMVGTSLLLVLVVIFQFCLDGMFS